MGFFFQPFVGLSPADAVRDAYRAQVARNNQMIARRNLAADRAAATELRRRALAHGTLDEVVRIICPPVKRKRGRQWGWRSEGEGSCPREWCSSAGASRSRSALFVAP